MYRDWFLENRIHVLIPRTYAMEPPISRVITTSNSAVLGQWTMPIGDKDEFVAYVAGSLGESGAEDEDMVENDGGMLVAGLIEFGNSQPGSVSLIE